MCFNFFHSESPFLPLLKPPVPLRGWPPVCSKGKLLCNEAEAERDRSSSCVALRSNPKIFE
jgi:hypothetical protein